MKGYSIQKHHGNWILRRSVYKDGKRTQPVHILASIRNYPKKADVVPLAEEHMQRVRRSKTHQAGASVRNFVENVFDKYNQGRLKKSTISLYAQNWRRLEPHIGSMRLRDVMTPHIQAALDAYHGERGEEIGHDAYLHLKVTASAIFSHAIRCGHHPGPNPENSTTVRGYGHENRRVTGAYDINEIKQFLTLFAVGDVAVAIAINAFLALRSPEIEGLTPEDAAFRAFDEQEFKVIFLDHDLHWMHADNSIFKGTGKEVARFIAKKDFQGIVIIHSKHEDGAAAMKKFLSSARLAPFGSFEITSEATS
jgi:hypothetical protein